MDLNALALSLAILPYLYRSKNDHHGISEDIRLSTFWSVWNLRRQLADLLIRTSNLLSAYPLRSSIIALSLSVLCICLSYSSITLRIATGQRHHGFDVNQAPSLRALIFPSRTSHTRVFPKKNSFSYSYLLVGIPVGWRGSIRSLLSADLDSLQRDGLRRERAWFSIEGADYLHRGYDARGLQGKLESYLKTQVLLETLLSGYG